MSATGRGLGAGWAALAAAALFATSAGCAHSLAPDLVPSARVLYQTDDGWTAGVRHYPGDGPPVLLVHGMAANHYNWDFHSSVSMVLYLQERGWDVWVAELRGDPEAVAPNKAARLYSVDDHAVHDIPAILDAVRDATGEEQVYWLGHSMGGMLLYTALELYPERIRAGVAMDSPAALPERSGLLGLASHLGWLTPEKGHLPAAGFGRATAWMGRTNPLVGYVGNRKNLDWPLVNGLARHALEAVPGPMQAQVISWLKAGEVLRVDGSPWFVRPDRPAVPLLVTGGSVDRIVPMSAAKAACDIFPACTFVELSQAAGFSADYGHVDPVLGRAAEAEVFPVVEGFLARERDADATAAAAPPVLRTPTEDGL